MRASFRRQSGAATAGRRLRWLALAVALGLAVPLALAAPPLGSAGGRYRVFWHTVDAGGDTSLGGSYGVTGVIGQPDAGIAVGGDYVLQSGFLPSKGAPDPGIFDDGFE